MKINQKNLTIIMVMLLILIITITMETQYRNVKLKQENQAINNEKQTLLLTNAQLAAKVADLEKSSQADSVLNEGLLEKKLSEKGITAAQLKAELLNRKDLIKHKPVLGGTMFFAGEGIHILTDKWVLAEFEDGHIGGYAFLKYDVNNGKISWSLVESYLFE